MDYYQVYGLIRVHCSRCVEITAQINQKLFILHFYSRENHKNVMTKKTNQVTDDLT